MRILMLNYEFPPLGGGGGVASYKLAKGFAKLGHKVDLITSDFQNLKKFEIIDGISVHRVPAPGRKNRATATFVSMFFYDFFAILKGFCLCRKHKYDFISTHFAIPTGPVGLILSKIFKVKNILFLHGGDVYDPSRKTSPHLHGYWRRIIRFILNAYYILVCQAGDTKENAIRWFEPKKEIYIIPLPYEKFKFQKIKRERLGLKKDRFYLISVGRMIERKGFKYLIRTMKDLPKKIELILLGDGPLLNPLKQIAQEENVLNRVHFQGFVSEEKKFQYLENSDLYVLSSLHEGFGIVLQEAMQVGLPIVATNNGGQIDLLKHEINALLVKPKSVKGLTQAIKKLYSNSFLRKSISKANLKRVNDFSLIKTARNYLDLL